MAIPENRDPGLRNHKSAPVPETPNGRHIESEETELVQNDPAERPVSGTAMDGLGESGDRDPLIGSAVGKVDEPPKSHTADAEAPAEGNTP